MTLGKRLAFGFAVCITFTIALGIFSYLRISAISALADVVVGDCLPGAALSGTFDGWARQEFSLLQKHVLTQDPQAAAKVEEELRKYIGMFGADTKSYQSNIHEQEDRDLFERTMQAYTAWMSQRESILALSRAGEKEKAAAQLPSASNAAAALTDLTGAMMAWNESNGKARGREITAVVNSSERWIVIEVVGSAVLVSAFSWLICRSISRALSRVTQSLVSSAPQVASASIQVSASSQTLAQGASEQAASLEETGSALNEMASMIKRNADTSAQAAGFSEEAKGSADRGAEAMNKMSSAIADIERSSQETAKIIRTIDEIAFQTNLLALNAAVEAARAGEAGKGFAVVAEEVRNLAMRSAEAARNTSCLIEESVSKAKNGVAMAQQVGGSLSEINNATTKVTGLIAEIAASSKEQSTSIDQITQAMSQMDKVTQSSAANAEETAAASEELNAQAEQLQSCVLELQTLVGVATRASTAAPAKTHTRPTSTQSLPKAADASAIPTQNRPARDIIPLELAQHTTSDFSEFSKAA